jgi:hypothetical protein
MLNDALALAATLLFLPVLGGTALGLASALWQTVTASTTPKWQTYLWFLAVGLALFRLPELGAVLSDGGN